MNTRKSFIILSRVKTISIKAKHKRSPALHYITWAWTIQILPEITIAMKLDFHRHYYTIIAVHSPVREYLGSESLGRGGEVLVSCRGNSTRANGASSILICYIWSWCKFWNDFYSTWSFEMFQKATGMFEGAQGSADVSFFGSFCKSTDNLSIIQTNESINPFCKFL